MQYSLDMENMMRSFFAAFNRESDKYGQWIPASDKPSSYSPSGISRLPERSGQLQSGGIVGVCFTSRKWTQKLRMREWRERSDCCWFQDTDCDLKGLIWWWQSNLGISGYWASWTLLSAKSWVAILAGSEFDPPLNEVAPLWAPSEDM